ncbi:receptor-type tyrosine-protein phosphatase H [Lissotriton helveticus]
MARALASLCPAVPLLVTVFFLCHGGTVILAQSTIANGENSTDTFTTEASTASPAAIPPQIDCRLLNWTATEDRITVELTSAFNDATAASENNKTTTPAVEVSRSSNISFTRLEPGCPYNVSLYSSSYQVCSILLYTRPAPVPSINVTGMTTKSVDVTLIPPSVTCVASYTYKASVSGGVITIYNNNRSVAVTALQPGQNYTLTVYSQTPSDARSSQKEFVIQTTPSPVSNFIVVNSSETSLTLQWTVPNDTYQNKYSYKVMASPTQNETFQSNVPGGGQQRGTIQNLSPGTSYDLGIYSITANDIQSTLMTIPVATTTPSPVSNFSVINRNETSLTLQWTVPTDQNQTSYTYMVVVVGTMKNATFASNVDGGAQQTGVISGLNPGVPYNLSITSNTADGVMSNAVTIKDATTMPSPVSNFNVINRNGTSLALQWTVPTDPNQTNYTYMVVVVGTMENVTFASNVGGGAQQTGVISGLNPGVPYNLSITSNTANGVMSTAVTIKDATTMPSPVSNFSVINRNETSLTLQWTVPTDQNQTSYTYTVVVVGTMKNVTFPSSVGGGAQQTGIISGLNPGVPYNLSITSNTANGVMSTAVTIKDATTMPSPVSNFSVINRNETSLTLQWTVPTDQTQTSYTYTVVVVGTMKNVTFPSSVGGGAQQTGIISGLNPGVSYNLNITSNTANGVMSTAVNIKDATTMPSPVSNFSVINRNETSLTLLWMVPTDQTQTSYTYTVVVVGTMKNVTFPSSVSGGAQQTGIISGLNPGVSYNLNITSNTANGVMSTAVTIKDATTMPSPVSNFNVIGRNETSLTLQWTVPSDTYQNKYRYMVVVVGTANDATFASSVGGGAQQTGIISGLNPGVPYNLSITSNTADGVMSTAVTINDATTNPSPVSNVNLKARTNSSITISWKKPDNPRVNDYTYWVNVQPSNFTVIVKDNISTQNNLQPGTLYTFIIQSVTVNNVSSTTTNYTSYSNPNPPENLKVSPVSDTVILIDWTAPKDPNAGRYQYNVTLANPTSAQTVRTTSTNGTTLTFGTLNPGNLYTARVNSWIEGASSTESQAPAQTQPQTVRKLNEVVITNTTAFFSWDVDLLSTSELSGFLINTTSASNDQKLTTLGPSARNYTITGLTPGRNYTFEFWSFVNSTWGPAAPSGSRRRRDTGSVITTYSPPMKQSAQTAPGIINGLQCKVVSGGYSLGVTWTCPSGSFDQIKVLLNDVEKTSTKECSGHGTVEVAGLQPAYKYKVSVRTLSGAKAVDSDVVLCETDPTGVIVGAIFGVLLFLVLIGIIIFFVLKFRRIKGGSTSGHGVSLNRRYPPDVSVGGFPSYFQRQHSDSDFGFAEEYQLLSPIGTDQQQTAAKQEENRPKNRYTNVLPYDLARVKLRSLPGDPCSDYINASYMAGYNSSKEFIAAQGPLPSTIGDFWRMVWEHRVGTMVMLTNCTEGGKLKCEHYWPLDYTPCTYGDITVTVTSETILPQWTTREFTLKNAKEPGLRYVSHFHYTVWPDHGVPDETATVIRFRNLVRDHMDQRRSNGPAVVHCSAGVGRTGTLIALDYLMQQVQNEKQVGVFSFIKKMRLNRPFMVQTESQYIFLNQCMLDVIQKPHVSTENIYENQMTGDLIYENVGAVKHYGNANGRMA